MSITRERELTTKRYHPIVDYLVWYIVVFGLGLIFGTAPVQEWRASSSVSTGAWLAAGVGVPVVLYGVRGIVASILTKVLLSEDGIRLVRFFPAKDPQRVL